MTKPASHIKPGVHPMSDHTARIIADTYGLPDPSGLPTCGGDWTPSATNVAPNGCDDCSVEPGETHRYPECPGNKRTEVTR